MSRKTILIGPHYYPNLEHETALARELDAQLIVSVDSDDFSSHLSEADVVMVTPYVSLPEPEIARMKSTAAIVRYGIGYNNIDARAATKRGIPVSVIPDSSSAEVASHAFAMGLSLLRRLPAGDAAIRSSEWGGTIAYDSPPLDSLKVGIVGYGRIGRRAAELYTAIGAQILIYDPFVDLNGVNQAGLDELLRSSDIISLHLPLSEDTRHMLGHKELSLLQSHAVIVNASRGGLIDEDALADVLQEGSIAGAALDSFESEPLPGDSPLRSVPNLIMTPHVAWRSNVAASNLQRAASERARLALSGKTMPTLVTE